MITALIIGLVLLTVLYMTYPRFLRRRVSYARFFNDLPEPRKRRSQLRFGKIQTPLSFLLQLVMLSLVLAALFFSTKKMGSGEDGGMGVWVSCTRLRTRHLRVRLRGNSSGSATTPAPSGSQTSRRLALRVMGEWPSKLFALIPPDLLR